MSTSQKLEELDIVELRELILKAAHIYVNRCSTKDGLQRQIDAILDQPYIDKLNLNHSASMALLNAELCTLKKIYETNPYELRRIRGIGEKTFDSIIGQIEALGYDYHGKWGRRVEESKEN